MGIIEFFRHEQKRLHDWMREAVSDLTVEEWNTMPAGNGNSIASRNVADVQAVSVDRLRMLLLQRH